MFHYPEINSKSNIRNKPQLQYKQSLFTISLAHLVVALSPIREMSLGLQCLAPQKAFLVPILVLLGSAIFVVTSALILLVQAFLLQKRVNKDYFVCILHQSQWLYEVISTGKT